jgi:hypothetical protein
MEHEAYIQGNKLLLLNILAQKMRGFGLPKH